MIYFEMPQVHLFFFFRFQLKKEIYAEIKGNEKKIEYPLSPTNYVCESWKEKKLESLEMYH